MNSLSSAARNLVANAHRGASDILYITSLCGGPERLGVSEATIPAVQVALETLASECNVRGALALPDEEWLVTEADGEPRLRPPKRFFPFSHQEHDANVCRIFDADEDVDPRIEARLERLRPEHKRRYADWWQKTIEAALALPDDKWLVTEADGSPVLRAPGRFDEGYLRDGWYEPRIEARIERLRPQQARRYTAWKQGAVERKIEAALAMPDDAWLTSGPDGGPDLRAPDEVVFAEGLEPQERSRILGDPRIQARLERLRPVCEHRLAEWRKNRDALMAVDRARA